LHDEQTKESHLGFRFPFDVSMSPCKRQLPFVCGKRKTEAANFLLFAENGNGNGKRKFVFLGRQTKSNRRLRLQQMYLAMYIFMLPFQTEN
jgi:hypothetical protein